MNTTARTLSYDQWWDTYKPEENIYQKGSHLYETFGEEEHLIDLIDNEYIWTLVECDGEQYIMNGRHYVNRVGYYITDNPWVGDDDITAEVKS